MSITYTCDYCGEEIGNEAYMTIEAGFERGSKKGGWRSGYFGHYHSSHRRGCYGAMRDALSELHGQGRAADDEHPNRPDELDRRDVSSKTMPRVERVHLVLNALGDKRLTLGELSARIEEQAGVWVYDSRLRPLVYQLHEAGELDRVGERRAKGDKPGAIRYRYLRRRELAGPIADLERALEEGGS